MRAQVRSSQFLAFLRRNFIKTEKEITLICGPHSGHLTEKIGEYLDESVEVELRAPEVQLLCAVADFLRRTETANVVGLQTYQIGTRVKGRWSCDYKAHDSLRGHVSVNNLNCQTTYRLPHSMKSKHRYQPLARARAKANNSKPQKANTVRSMM